ncbi:DsbE family thiol:disulfide interchange protein [Thalassococcus sp. CAU 1522]|uniref:DsbE family thiol:disulfide interchange protein n=2 Tax=Thalassococcus arenae TaxID=2851652 RepID=A0ABS6NBA8_9RHOB|nr:DsbE family thiol:disulfide interchange protein [Thalassococcus arenae]
MMLPPLIFAAFAIMALFGMYRENPRELPSTRIGQQAPALPSGAMAAFPGAGDDVLRTGEVTLVNFWASWCPPCRAEHPKLLEMQDAGIRIVGVNFKDQESTATRYLTEDGNPFIGVPFDPAGRTAIDWGVTAPPETFIVAGDGTVLFRFVGPLVGSDYQQRFVPELEKALAASQ